MLVWDTITNYHKQDGLQTTEMGYSLDPGKSKIKAPADLVCDEDPISGS